MKVEIHIHHHDSGDSKEVLSKLNHILQNQKIIMSKQEQMDAALQELNEATTAIGNRIQAFIDANADNVSQESLDALKADADALKAMGNPPATGG